MRIHWMRALTAVAVLAAPAFAMAQVSAARAQTFRERDTNHDGVLTLEEYGGHPGNFRAMDANGDGVLSFDEFVNRYREGNDNAPAAAPAPQVTTQAPFPSSPVVSAEARFRSMDLNNNGYISRSEWRGESVSFDVVDRNRDGRITMDEYLNQSAYGTGDLEWRFGQLDRNHDGVINRGEWRGERLSFDAVDRNGDNRVTLDEYVNQGTDGYDNGYGSASGGMQARFEQMDRNRDGVLSRGEWRDSTPFRQVDRNNDGVVTLREYLNASVVYEQPSGYDQYGTSGSTAFRDLDRNGSGYIERREWPYDLTEFDRMDRNGDGRLSTYEYDGGRGTSPGAYEEFRRLDRNGDGVISRREWSGTTQSFEDYDRDRDGLISRDEFLNYRNYTY